MKIHIALPIWLHRSLFLLLAAACVVFPVDAPVALLAGLLLALTIGHPFPAFGQRATPLLLQLSVVCLGFHINLQQAMQAGSRGLLLTIASISITLITGYFLGKKMKMDKVTSYLISAGTAICGGSAIAAVGPIAGATGKQMSVALGTVFILNAVALFIFPGIGHLAHLSQTQFGTWCAIAIHDTSSVVGAAGKYGQQALQVAITVKLERALWIVPLSLGTAFFQKNRGKVKLPYFILYFIAAIFIYTYLPQFRSLYSNAYVLGKKGLILTLFLIGSGLSVDTVRSVGWRPIFQGVLLWMLIGTLSLVAIKYCI